MWVIEMLEICLLLAVVYISIVLVVQVVNHWTTEEAISVVNKKIRALLKGIINVLCDKEENNTSYNIYIGLDGNLNPMSNILDKEFEDLGKIFKTYYFGDLKITQDIIGYRFYVSEPVNEMDKEDLYELCSKVCESIVHKILHRTCPSFCHLDSLTAVIVGHGYIDVYIAETPLGQQSNARLTNKIRGQFKLEKETQTAPIEEDWGDSE